MKIVTVSHKESVLKENLLQSEMFRFHVLHIAHTNSNVPQAINEASKGNIGARMFVHNDVFIPKDFELQLVKALYSLPNDWGILGLAGASMVKTHQGSKRLFFGHVMDRGNVWGTPFLNPIKVQTVDELLIIVNDAHGTWEFDEQFPFDFYGADICMQAHERGLGVYVIPAFVHHNSSRKVGERTPSFYESEAKFREKWKHRLPIATTCSILK